MATTQKFLIGEKVSYISDPHSISGSAIITEMILDGEKFRKAWESGGGKTILGGSSQLPRIHTESYVPNEEESRLLKQLRNIALEGQEKGVPTGLMKVITGMQERSVNCNIKMEVREGVKNVLDTLVKKAGVWGISRNMSDLSFNVPMNELGVATSYGDTLEMVENSFLDDLGLRKLNKLRKIRSLDKNPRTISVETIVPGLYLLELPDQMNTASRFTTKFVDGGKVAKSEVGMDIRQEAIQILGREIKIDKTNVSRSEVRQIEEDLKRLKPMSPDFDNLLKDYFDFLTGEIWGVLCIREAGRMIYPIDFYDGKVKSLDQLKDKIIEIAIAERRAIRERGKNDTGQIGRWFWDTSSVDTLGEDKEQLDTVISLAVKHLGIDPDEFFRRVNG